MREHTPRPRPQTPEPPPITPTPETHPLTGLEKFELVTPGKPCQVVPTVREAEEAGHISDRHMDPQPLSESALRDSLRNVFLPDAPLPQTHPDVSVGEEWTSPQVEEEAMVVVFGLGLGSCLLRFLWSNLFISGIDYYTRGEVFGLLRVYFIYGFWIGFILFIVLWEIAHAAFLQLLACKEPLCDGVEAQ